MRELEDHKVTKLNRECIVVTALDETDSDGANHLYCVEVMYTGDTAINTDYPIHRTDLKFQKGGLAEAGPNGITDQALLAIVLDRMKGFQEGPYSDASNDIVISSLKTCLEVMEARANSRAARGVEGVRAK